MNGGPIIRTCGNCFKKLQCKIVISGKQERPCWKPDYETLEQWVAGEGRLMIEKYRKLKQKYLKLLQRNAELESEVEVLRREVNGNDGT